MITVGWGPILGIETISHLGGDELQPSTLSVLLLLQEAPHLGVVLRQTLLSCPLSGAAHAPGAQTSWGPEEQQGLSPKRHFQKSNIRLVKNSWKKKKKSCLSQPWSHDWVKKMHTHTGEDLLATQSRAAAQLNKTLMRTQTPRRSNCWKSLLCCKNSWFRLKEVSPGFFVLFFLLLLSEIFLPLVSFEKPQWECGGGQ